MFLDRIIFRQEDFQYKLLSKGKDLILEKALEFNQAKEVTDANYNEVHKNETMAVDTVCKSFGSLHIKDRCYNCGKQHEKDCDTYLPRNSLCHYCHKQGHFKKVCIKKDKGLQSKPVRGEKTPAHDVPKRSRQ